MASREGVDVWLEDDDLWCDVYLPDTKQWVVAHLCEIDTVKRNICVEYSDGVHNNEWLNIDTDIYRLCELGGKTNKTDTTVDVHGNIVYIQDSATQIKELIDAVVNGINEKYADTEKQDQINKLSDLCTQFTTRWLNSTANKSDDDIRETSMQIPFYDPLTHCFIRVSARGVQCEHASTFDVRSYLEHNVGKSDWKCCICNNECLPFDLDIDMFMLNLLHSNGYKSNQCTIDSSDLAEFVRKQLELGLSEQFEDRYVVVNANGTYQLSTDIQASKQANKRNSMAVDESHTEIKHSKHTKHDDIDIEIIDDDDDTVVQPKSIKQSNTQSHTQSSNGDPKHRIVIDLTQDTNIYDSYIKRIKVKEENIAAREQIAKSQQQRMAELQAVSTPQYSVPACDRVAAGVIAFQQQAQKYSLNLNTATVKDLTKLPGIGATSAQRIVQYREERVAKLRQLQPNATTIKAFNHPSDILSCPKVSYNTLDKLRHLVHC